MVCIWYNDAVVLTWYVYGIGIAGASIIQPVKNHPKKCRLTMLTQLDPGGFLPPVIVNQVSCDTVLPNYAILIYLQYLIGGCGANNKRVVVKSIIFALLISTI